MAKAKGQRAKIFNVRSFPALGRYPFVISDYHIVIEIFHLEG